VGVQHVFNKTQVLFGRHRAGYIFPMLLSVSRLENEFAGVMQRIDSPDQYIFFSVDTFRVTAASQEALQILGVSFLPLPLPVPLPLPLLLPLSLSLHLSRCAGRHAGLHRHVLRVLTVL
jgi:hypothetical protein